MPELPEVQTVVAQLARHLPGRAIVQVDVLFPDLLSETPAAFCRGLTGRNVVSVERRGKNIVLPLDDTQRLVVNLGMTGQLLYQPGEAGADREDMDGPSHPAIQFQLQPGGSLTYADVRRFGSLRRFGSKEWRAESARLGPEPLSRSLTGSAFHAHLSRSRSPVRSWLLDQTRIAGVGNIYANEALFRVGIHPRTAANEISAVDAGRLLRALRRVLREAIKARGTTLRDYRTATGDMGSFGPALRIYGRDGEPCPRCKSPIERIVFANRSAFLCPQCQGSP
jgi:formamidopyrimidine-DNA glycosylase